MLKKIDYWLKGYLRIEITGPKLERLINLLNQANIELWNIVDIEGTVYANIRLKDFKRIRKQARKVDSRVSIESKHGLAILLKQMISRKFLVLGVIIFIILIYLLSSFVFFIEIKGTDKLSSKKVLKQLKELQVQPGVLKSSIAIDDLEEIILKKNRQIAWVNLYFRGSKLIVKIVEKKLIDTEIKPKNIIAQKPGIITKLIVLKGTAKVKEGDTVAKGELLISKEVKVVETTSEEEVKTNNKIVKAAGIVKAKVWYEGYGEANLVEEFLQKTSEIAKNIILKYKNKEIILNGPKKTPYKYFKVKETIKRIPQWRNINLPLEIVTRKYIKLKKLKVRRTTKQAKEIAKEKAVESILQQIPKEVIILNSNLKLIENKKDNNLIRVKAILEVEEDIAVRRE